MLSPNPCRKIDREIAKYPADQKQSAVMARCIIAQDEKGWLSTETMDFVAQLPRHAAGRGVRGGDASTTCTTSQPVGKYKLTVCTSLPCALQGVARGGRPPEEEARHRLQRDHAPTAGSP